jgi:curved DNA-binding protein CbpA
VSDFEHLNYYELLGIARSATPDEIKRAYRREISKYHPDRFGNATPQEREYASLRSQRLTEAYGVLNDVRARSAYNRGETPIVGKNRPPRPAPPPQRDHQAELYAQAQEHFEAGRLLQAIGVLRQLHQINPFYRDSADMLAAAEAQLTLRSERAARRPSRALFILGGLAGVIAMIALATWALNSRGVTAGRIATVSTNVEVDVPTDMPTRPPEPTVNTTALSATPTVAALQPTAAPIAPTSIPTAAPTTPPTALPAAVLPTALPTAAPTEAPATAAPVAPEAGQILSRDAFAAGGWAESSGTGWRVGYQRGRYHVRGDAGTGAIWSYRTAPADDASVGVDVQVTTGEGGLLVRFLDQANYLSITLNPSQTSFRIEEHAGNAVNVLAGGQSEAIGTGADTVNRLVARLRGDSLQVLVNGQQLADVQMSGAANSPRYGLLVFAKDSASEAFFDNLEIRALDS